MTDETDLKQEEFRSNSALAGRVEPVVMCKQSAVIEVDENFYLRATLACIANKNEPNDTGTLQAIARNALDTVSA